MEASGVRVSPHTITPPSDQLITHTYAIEQALALWADFKTSGLLADRILYLSLMNALNHKAGGWADAEVCCLFFSSKYGLRP